jgi:hypothetical protein
MASTINASTSAGVVTTADTSGNLNLQSNGTTIVALTSAGAAVTGTQSVSGAFTEPKRAAVYVYTAWDPTDNAGTLTNAPSTSTATSTAASYITFANASGTVTFTSVIAGTFRFTLTMQNKNGTISTALFTPSVIGGTGTILLGTSTLINPIYLDNPSGSGSFQMTGSTTFYATLTVGQTVTILPRVRVNSAGVAAQFTTQATVSAEYCGAT